MSGSKKSNDTEGTSMKDAMQHYLKVMGVDRQMLEASVLSSWDKMMGEAVAKRTERKYIKDRVLYIEMNSSVMRDELFQQRSEIVKKINEMAGISIIDEIYLA